MVCPILISVSVTPGAFCAAAGRLKATAVAANTGQMNWRIRFLPNLLALHVQCHFLLPPRYPILWESLAVRPNPIRDFTNEPQLRLLLRQGHSVGKFAGCKAALRAQREPLQRNDLGCLADASLDCRRI